ncbi:uncharacterized protein TNCV_2711431 [Trichonephila clavipes]|nr:uncharacterized protein TNCV_2711431 [Trichonephila clavipes]
MSKGIKLSDGKNISGRGRLTLKEVDSIQHYYGLAIRKNLSSVEDMKRAIWAIYFHKLSTEDNPQHALCPLEKDLLKKCLHGRTQNPNESFNKCIWERIPKTVFVGIETLKFGVMDAVICFNDGYVSRIKVFEALGIKPGYNTERALLIIDNKRIFEAERIVNKVSLEARNKSSSHKVALCKSSRNCPNCSKRHNSLLCRNFERNVDSQRSPGSETLPNMEPRNTPTSNVNSECFQPKKTIPSCVESFENGGEFVGHSKGHSTMLLSTALITRTVAGKSFLCVPY